MSTFKILIRIGQKCSACKSDIVEELSTSHDRQTSYVGRDFKSVPILHKRQYCLKCRIVYAYEFDTPTKCTGILESYMPYRHKQKNSMTDVFFAKLSNENSLSNFINNHSRDSKSGFIIHGNKIIDTGIQVDRLVEDYEKIENLGAVGPFDAEAFSN